jgi:hypothetical protein
MGEDEPGDIDHGLLVHPGRTLDVPVGNVSAEQLV